MIFYLLTVRKGTIKYWAVVVAQLVPIPEVCGSNPFFNCIEETKIKKQRPGMAHLRKQ